MSRKKYRPPHRGHSVDKTYDPNPRRFGAPARDYYEPREDWIFDHLLQRYVLKQTTFVPGHVEEFITNSVDGDRVKPNAHGFTRRIYDGLRGRVDGVRLDTAFTPPKATPQYSVGIVFDPVQHELMPHSRLKYTGGESYNELFDKALQKCFDGVPPDSRDPKGHPGRPGIRGQANLLVDVAEGHQTVRMLKSLANLKHQFNDFANTNLFFDLIRQPKGQTPGSRAYKYWSNRWMEARYGITPAMSSLYAAIDEFVRPLSGNPIQTFKGRSGRSRRAQGYHTPVSTTGITQWRVVESLSERVEVSLTLDMGSPPPLANWTTLNPASLIWELTPYSFVWDWLFNVSDYLRSWENRMIYDRNFLYGYVTNTHVHTAHSAASGPDVDVTGFYQEKVLMRTPLVSIPTVHFGFKPNLNSKKIADAAILLEQMFRSKRPR